MINCVKIQDSQIASPYITIAIPTYKRGELLAEAVDSALHQDIQNVKYEVLVVDNHPERDDTTEQLMRKYADVPEVAYYKNEENVGPVGNWNRLYDLAKGEYVVMLHDDDMLFPYYLRVVTSFLKQTNYIYKLVYPDYHFSRDRVVPDHDAPLELRYREMAKEDYLVWLWGLPTGLLIRNEECHIIGGYKNDFWPINDQEFIYRSLHFVKGANILFPLCFYYIGANASLSPKVIIDGICQTNEFNKHILKDKANKLRWLARLCKRQQIANMINWDRFFVSDEVLEEALDKINYKKNKWKDRTSRYVVRFIKYYSNAFRIHSFRIDSNKTD